MTCSATRFYASLVSAIGLSFPAIAATVAAPPIIGVVTEEAAPVYPGTLRTGLRLAFVKHGVDWRQVCPENGVANADCTSAASSPAQWQIIYRGKRIGALATQGWLADDRYSDRGTLAIAAGSMPHIGERSEVFAGWSASRVYRPLVATNSVTASDRSWKNLYPENVPAGFNPLPALQKLVGTLPDCDADPERQRGKERPIVQSDVHITANIELASGERLVAASIKPDRVKSCDYTANLLADVWFVNVAKSGWRPLPGLIAGETTHVLLDEGNLGGDDENVALFWQPGYTAGGFVIYYDHFAKFTPETWSYH
jgi:hypothetical protein